MSNKLKSGTRDLNIGSHVSITYYGSWPLCNSNFKVAKSGEQVIEMV